MDVLSSSYLTRIIPLMSESNLLHFFSFNKVATPIQALMVNRLICCQFEVVKVLWRYDKKNSLTNALLLWIMVEGILQRKKKMFKRKHSLEDFQKFKK